MGGSWTVHEYQTDSLQLTVAAAPSSEPHARRANTADAYRWLAEDLVHLTRGQRLLAVTTPIFVPAQHCAAVACCPFRTAWRWTPTAPIRHGCPSGGGRTSPPPGA